MATPSTDNSSESSSTTKNTTIKKTPTKKPTTRKLPVRKTPVKKTTKPAIEKENISNIAVDTPITGDIDGIIPSPHPKHTSAACPFVTYREIIWIILGIIAFCTSLWLMYNLGRESGFQTCENINRNIDIETYSNANAHGYPLGEHVDIHNF